MAVGFDPQAPTSGEDADGMTDAALFWVTKNGIRFTAMPAWTPSRAPMAIRERPETNRHAEPL